jgi:hypothetical protein
LPICSKGRCGSCRQHGATRRSVVLADYLGPLDRDRLDVVAPLDLRQMAAIDPDQCCDSSKPRNSYPWCAMTLHPIIAELLAGLIILGLGLIAWRAAEIARMVERAGVEAKLALTAHPHKPRHACGFALANKGHDTCALQAYLGRKKIQHKVRYTEMSPTRFKDFF